MGVVTRRTAIEKVEKRGKGDEARVNLPSYVKFSFPDSQNHTVAKRRIPLSENISIENIPARVGVCMREGTKR